MTAMSAYDTNKANSLIHLYRGEMGKMVFYQTRLDTTTNWAIVTTAGMASFGLSNPGAPHAVFLFAMALVYFFLYLESRRFLVYEMSHYRVRLLERFFYHEMLDAEVDPSWRERLLAELAKPTRPRRRLQAMGRRLRRTYLWIYAALIIAWAFKLYVMGGRAESFTEFASRANVGPMPGLLTVGVVLSFYAVAFALVVYASRDYGLKDA